MSVGKNNNYTLINVIYIYVFILTLRRESKDRNLQRVLKIHTCQYYNLPRKSMRRRMQRQHYNNIILPSAALRNFLEANLCDVIQIIISERRVSYHTKISIAIRFQHVCLYNNILCKYITLVFRSRFTDNHHQIREHYCKSTAIVGNTFSRCY